jgi:hypothetical protein
VFEASYRLEPAPAGSELVRYFCTNGTRIVVAHHVQTAVATRTSHEVNFAVTVLVNSSPYSFNVSASRRTTQVGSPITTLPGPPAVDTTPPAAPSVPVLASDSGVPGDNITNVKTPTFTGTAEANSTVTLYDGLNLVGTATATGGTYSVTASALADGSHTMTAKATDGSGNVSAPSGGLVVTIVNGVPSTPVLAAASDSGAPGDNITNVTTPTFTGTAEANSIITLFDGAIPVGTATTTGGNYAITASSLADGIHSMTANATDGAGYVSAASAAQAVTIDTVAPAAPASLLYVDGNHGQGDNVTGRAEANSVVMATETQGPAVGSAYVATSPASGSFTITVENVNGADVTYSIVARDAAGNVSPATSLSFVDKT